MTTVTIIKKAVDDDVDFVLSDSGGIRLSGDKKAVNRWVSVVREHKQAIIAALTHYQVSTIRTWLNQIGQPEEDHDNDIVLDKYRRDLEALAYYLEQATEYEREKQQQKVFNMLAENTYKKRVYVTDTTADHSNVILIFAIRDVACFDILIP